MTLGALNPLASVSISGFLGTEMASGVVGSQAVKWPSFPNWCVEYTDVGVSPLTPGLTRPSLPTVHALALVRERLKSKLMTAMSAMNMRWPRIGLWERPARMPKKQAEPTSRIVASSDEPAPEGMGRNCVVWIARLDALQQAMEAETPVTADRLHALGTLRVVWSVGMGGSPVTVAPRLNDIDLPGPHGIAHRRFDDVPLPPGNDDSITLLLLLLDDVFEYQFLYEAMRSVAQEYFEAPAVAEPTGLAACCGAVSTAVAKVFKLSPKRHPALRYYLGLDSDCAAGTPSSVLTSTLGVVGHRNKSIRIAATTLGLTFSAEQVGVLNGLKDAVNVINCVAGAGKTELLLAIAIQFVLQPKENDGVVFMVAPTRTMVGELYMKMKGLGLDMSLVARNGDGASGGYGCQ